MSKIKFDYSGLNNTVIPSIDDAVNTLDSLINLSNSLSVPVDFSYLGYLRNLKSGFSKSRKELINIKNWIDKNNKRLENTMVEINANLDKITKITVKKRESAIR